VGKIVTTHLVASAPISAVWRLLIDLDGYRTWNPYITDAAGTVDVGQRLTLTVQVSHSHHQTCKPWVTAVEQHRYVEWLSRTGLPGVFDTRHSVKLTPMMGGGRILIQQSATFTGLVLPRANALLGRTRDGFAAMNEALAREAVRIANWEQSNPGQPT
jgi:hypothetical protein